MLPRLRRLWALSATQDTLADLIAEGVVEWGAHSYGDPRVLVWRSPIVGRVGGRVKVGKYCSIAGGVQMLTDGNHRTDWLSTYPFRTRWDMPGRDRDGFPTPSDDITIGNDVWIGQDAMILPGVTIGDGAVVAARALIARDVRPYAIVAGNPQREIRRRLSEEQIEILLQVRWWDWPEEKVRRNVHLLCSDNADALAAAL
jgi:acetyltransferase-like isoleucine patch superfamily enzyme